MKVDTRIIDAKIVFPNGIFEAGIAINDGKIVSIGKEPILPPADKTINVKGDLLIPGVIDGHVHLGADSRRPGGESFITGTAAAAVGGVTTLGIMPTGKSLTENRDSFL